MSLVVIDWDDVVSPFNQLCLKMLSEEKGIDFSIDEITRWGKVNSPVDERFKYFEKPDIFEKQVLYPGAEDFLRQLMKKAEVVIATAVPPEFMGLRIKKISELLPFFPLDHVIMGTRKDLIHSDVMIDDGLHNLVEANCTLPIVFDQPWNRHISGICRARGYDEILTILDFMTGNKMELTGGPKVVCFIGPSGSGKNELADKLCEDKAFRRVGTVTTAKRAPSHGVRVSYEQYYKMAEMGLFVESTSYTGDLYGIVETDIDNSMKEGKSPVVVSDVCGCVSIYNRYPGRCQIFYVDTPKRECVENVICKVGLTRSQIADRLVSMDYERKNRILADHVVCAGTTEEMATQVKSFL